MPLAANSNIKVRNFCARCFIFFCFLAEAIAYDAKSSGWIVDITVRESCRLPEMLVANTSAANFVGIKLYRLTEGKNQKSYTFIGYLDGTEMAKTGKFERVTDMVFWKASLIYANRLPGKKTTIYIAQANRRVELWETGTNHRLFVHLPFFGDKKTPPATTYRLETGGHVADSIPMGASIAAMIADGN